MATNPNPAEGKCSVWLSPDTATAVRELSEMSGIPVTRIVNDAVSSRCRELAPQFRKIFSEWGVTRALHSGLPVQKTPNAVPPETAPVPQE